MIFKLYKELFFSKKKKYKKIIVELVCIINSSKNKNLAALSVKKYSDNSYNFQKNQFLNLLIYIFLLFFIGFFMLIKSNSFIGKRKEEKVDIIIHARNKKIYYQFFSKISKKLNKFNYKIQGETFDYPIIGNNFNIANSIRVILLIIFFMPLIIVLSFLSKKNYFQSIVRSIIIYSRTFNHFKLYPTNIYLTFEDNGCSPAFYDAFKNSGGIKLLAYQNGLRFREKSLVGNCFDHLFCYGQSSLELYKSLNAKIVNYDFVPSIILSNNKYLKKKKKEIIDILFIDEGLPYSSKNSYTYDFNKQNYLKMYIKDIIQFSKNNNKLNIVFQLRPYENFENKIFEYAKSLFINTQIKVNKNIDDYETYRKIQYSKMIVTNQSTIGIEALSMGKTAIFTNHSKRNEILVNHPFQLDYKGYKSFEDIIIKFLNKKNKKLINRSSFFVIPAKSVDTNDILYKRICEYLNDAN